MKRRATVMMGALVSLLPSLAVANEVPWPTAAGASPEISFSIVTRFQTSTSILDLYTLDPGEESVALPAALPPGRGRAGIVVIDDSVRRTAGTPQDSIPTLSCDSAVTLAPPGTTASRTRWCKIKNRLDAAPFTPVRLSRIDWNTAQALLTPWQEPVISSDFYDLLPTTISLIGSPTEWSVSTERLTSVALLKRSLALVAAATSLALDPRIPSPVAPPPSNQHIHPDVGLKIYFPRRVMRDASDDLVLSQKQDHALWAYRLAHLVGRLNLETAIQYARQAPISLRFWNGPLAGSDIDNMAYVLARGSIEQVRLALNEEPYDSSWVRLIVSSFDILCIEFSRVHRDWRMTNNLIQLLTSWDTEVEGAECCGLWHENIEEFSGIPEPTALGEGARKPTLTEWLGRAKSLAASAAYVAGVVYGFSGAAIAGSLTANLTGAQANAVATTTLALADLISLNERPPLDSEFESRAERVGYWAARVAQLVTPVRDIARRLYNYSQPPRHSELGDEWATLFQESLTKLSDSKNTDPSNPFQRPRLTPDTLGITLLLSRWSLPFLKWERWIGEVGEVEYARLRALVVAERAALAKNLFPQSWTSRKAQASVPSGHLDQFFPKVTRPATSQAQIEIDIGSFFDKISGLLFRDRPEDNGTLRGISLSTFAADPAHPDPRALLW